MTPVVVILVLFLLAISRCSNGQAVANLAAPCGFGLGSPTCGRNAYCNKLQRGCSMGICACNVGRYGPASALSPSDCARILRVGQNCSVIDVSEVPHWILPEFSTCGNSGIVECLAFFRESDGNCIPSELVISQVGQPCDPVIGCNPYSGLICAVTEAMLAPNGTTLTTTNCICPNKLIFREGFCRPAVYGDPCMEDAECNTILQGSAICQEDTKRCICNDGFVAVATLVTLPPHASEQILVHLCLAADPEVPMSGLGDECTVAHRYNPQDSSPVILCDPELVCVGCPEILARNSSNTRGRCQFADSKVLNADFWPIGLTMAPILSTACLLPDNQNNVRSDSTCGLNAECVSEFNNGPCKRGRCLCKNSSFVPSPDDPTVCLPRLKVGDLCNYGPAQLLPSHSHCVNNIVRCDGILLPNRNGECALSPAYGTFGDFCNDDYFGCNFLAGLICINATQPDEKSQYGSRYCSCEESLIFKNGRCQPALFGDPCTKHIQCSKVYRTNVTFSPSYCHGFECICKPGFSPAGFQDETYCIENERLVKEKLDSCLASSPIDYSDDLEFCAPGLRCWHCPEYGRDFSEGMCYDDTLYSDDSSKNSKQLAATTAKTKTTTQAAATTANQRQLMAGARRNSKTISSAIVVIFLLFLLASS